MSKRVLTEVVDDLNGKSGAHEVTFSLHGVFYRIDLTDQNTAKLEKALAPFIGAATVDRNLRQYRKTGVGQGRRREG